MGPRIVIVAPSLDILGGQGIQAQALVEHLTQERRAVSVLQVNPQFPRGSGWIRRIPYARTVFNQALTYPVF